MSHNKCNIYNNKDIIYIQVHLPRLNLLKSIKHLNNTAHNQLPFCLSPIKIESFELDSNITNININNNNNKHIYKTTKTINTTTTLFKANFIKYRLDYIYKLTKDNIHSLEWQSKFRMFCETQINLRIDDLIYDTSLLHKLRTNNLKERYVLSMNTFWYLFVLYLCEFDCFKFNLFIDVLKFAKNYVQSINKVVHNLFNLQSRNNIFIKFSKSSILNYCLNNQLEDVYYKSSKDIGNKKNLILNILKLNECEYKCEMKSKCKKSINEDNNKSVLSMKVKKHKWCFSCDKIKEVYTVGRKKGIKGNSSCKGKNKVECFVTNGNSNGNNNITVEAYKEGFNSLTHNINKVKI